MANVSNKIKSDKKKKTIKKDKLVDKKIDEELEDSLEVSKIDRKVKKDKKNSKSNVETKNNLWDRFMTFCHGVGQEAHRIHWPSRKDMVKYSWATIVFIIAFSLYFYLINIIFAAIQSLFS